jgi:hypothetical protein
VKKNVMVFLDIEKAFHTTWHPGLLYKLEFSINLVKLISSFLSQRKFRVSVEGEMSTPREMQAGVPQGSVLSPTLYNVYFNDTPKHLVLILPSLLMTPVCMRQSARRAMFSESCSAVLMQSKRGLSAGT